MSETRSDIEGVESAMSDTADEAGNSAEELQGFSEKFQGAMSAAVAGLALGAAGLLSQVPVVGEAFSGLRAIVDQLILLIDKDLRPALSGFTNDLFGVAQDVGEADSSIEGLVEAIDGVGQAIQDTSTETLQQEIQELTGVTIPENWLDLGWDVITMDTRNAVDTLKRTVKEFPDDFGTFLGSIAPKAGKEYDKIVSKTRSFVNDAVEEVRDFPSRSREFFTGLASDLNSWAGELAQDARGWGTDLIQGFIDGIQTRLSKLQDFLANLRSIGGNVGIDVPTLGGIGGGGSGADGNGATVTRSPFGGTGIGRRTQLDGRTLTESTGRYRSDPSRRRGL